MRKFFPTGFLMMLIFGILSLTGCKKENNLLTDSGVNAPNRFPIYMTPSDYNAENTYYLLNDDESPEVFFDRNQRNFSTMNPLQMTFGDDYYFQIRFYSPRALPNVTIWAKIDGYEEEFRLLSLDKLMPFQQLRVHLPLDTEDITARTRSGKTIKIMANPHLSAANFTFTVESDSPYWQTLKSITVDWNVWFGRYDPNHPNWKYPLHACHAREGVALALNLTYMFSTQEFESKVNGWGPLYANADKKPIDRAALIKSARSKRGICYGLVSGSVVGLGGGSTFGLAEYVYFGHYGDDDAWPETAFHEFGHILGYGHGGNMTYYPQAEPGWTILGCQLYEKLSVEKKLPIYSRRFLHSRKSKSTYAGIAGSYHKSKNIIEDPELDEIDGGLIHRGENDQKGENGEALSFTLDHTAVPDATAATFRPKDVYVYNDSLFVVNDAKEHYSVEIFDIKNGKISHLKSIREWTRADGTTEHFLGEPNGVTRANGKIYVTHTGSRTEVFDAEDQHFIGCLGNGNWGTGAGQTVHAFDIVVYNGLMLIHDKRYLVVAEEAMLGQLDPMLVYARSENLGETAGTYGMAVDTTSGILYATHPAKRIDQFDLSQIREYQEIKRSGSLTYKNAPYALDFYGTRLFVSSNGDEKFCEVDPKTGAILKNHTTVGGITLQAPEKFCIRRKTLFIIDRAKDGARLYAIPMSELN
ncbi:hypothetical protein [uncultured Rikenella sp.]|uniref:hypothetical protein n=1 Tax=uncultured Rikenella sp. TaxID=368003 RepID=UPI0025CEACFB|nr:hypothetical protein [uncultured Rikenella sp.]